MVNHSERHVTVMVAERRLPASMISRAKKDDGALLVRVKLKLLLKIYGRFNKEVPDNVHDFIKKSAHRRVMCSSELLSDESRRFAEGTTIAHIFLQQALSFRTGS